MTGDKQHFLPAALIGGFGHAATGQPLREAQVLWRRREWSQPRPTKAENIGYVKRMYRLAAPPPGFEADMIDELWEGFEDDLPEAVARTASRQETSDDQYTLVKYIAAAGVRHPDFAEAVNRWRDEQGMGPVTGDDVQLARVGSLAEGLKLVQGFRWRFVHSPASGPPFILNDRGWSYIGEQDRPGRGLWIPLSAEVALLAWLQSGADGVFDHLTIWPGWAKWLNAATWEDAPQFVVGHPDDRSQLEQLTSTGDVKPSLERIGPYRNTRQHLFSDFR